VEKLVTLTPWTLPLDEPEPGDYPLTNNSAYRMKRSVSPVKRKDTSAAIAPGGINATITKGITPSVTSKPKKGKPRKNKKRGTQTTRPSKTVFDFSHPSHGPSLLVL